jgi:hypothetical protein
MSEAAVIAQAGAPFAPRALVPISVGRLTVYVYPGINSTMLPHEGAHAYHINLTALTSQNLDLRLQLDALGHQLNLQATVDGIVNDWLRFFTITGVTFAISQSSAFIPPLVKSSRIRQQRQNRMSYYPFRMETSLSVVGQISNLSEFRSPLTTPRLLTSRNQWDQRHCGRNITWSCRRLHE